MRTIVPALVALLLAACSAANEDGPARGEGETSDWRGASDTSRGEVPDRDTDDANPAVTLDTVGSDSGGEPDTRVDRDTGRGSDECTQVNATGDPAFAPVDIIWVIDTSGSMTEERVLVESQLNEFVGFIEDSGLDVRVVMIGDDSVCVPDPLSGGGCPDTDSVRYRHIRRTVGSHDAFEHIVEAYPEYGDFLRTEAVHHFVVVSDDESDTNARDFRDQMSVLRVGRWAFHAIVSLVETCGVFPPVCEGCSGPHGDAEAKGDRYILASEMTDGTANSICASDWAPTFEAIAENVVVGAVLPCQYIIPDLGEGLEIVYDRVDVTINGVPLTRHDSSAGCETAPGWYYDDTESPEQVILCPGFCGTGFEGDEVEIHFGCVKA